MINTKHAINSKLKSALNLFSFLVIFTLIVIGVVLLVQTAASAQESSSSQVSVSTDSISSSESSEQSISSESSSSKPMGNIDVDNVLELELTKNTQDIFSHAQPVILTIKSNIDVERLEVQWSFDEKNLKLDSDDTVYTTVNVGEPRVGTFKFTPKKPSNNRVFVKVTAWQNNINYTQVGYIDLNFDKNLEIVPQTQDYRNKQTLRTIVELALVIAIIIGLAFFGRSLYRRFKTWYDKDDE